MATKRKKPDEPFDGAATAVADPPLDQTAVPEAPPNGQPAEPAPKPVPNRPAASFAAHSDRTTRIEVAVWAKKVTVSAEEEYTQYALTLSRSWRDKEGQWFGNASFRIHDIPVLLYLVQQAYHWCVAQRTTVTIGDEPVPF